MLTARGNDIETACPGDSGSLASVAPSTVLLQPCGEFLHDLGMLRGGIRGFGGIVAEADQLRLELVGRLISMSRGSRVLATPPWFSGVRQQCRPVNNA